VDQDQDDEPTDDAGTGDVEQTWMSKARCRGHAPQEFFPSDGVGVDRARQFCAGCDVRVECLEYALEHRIDHGVWGGCSERERRRILRRRRGLQVLGS
jgi:WhiB family transcriptional regulator, redox-sensing transcriptional regulator